MKIRTMIFVALLVITGMGKANAEALTGMALLKICESDIVSDEGFCSGYFFGLIQTHRSLSEWNHLNKKHFCAPETVTIDQYKKIYIKYANDHPEELHYIPSGLVLKGLAEAFPCE